MNSKRLYWTDSALYHIKSSSLDGTGVKLVSIDVSSLVDISIVVMGIDLYGSYMYVSNLGTGIYRIQKNKQNAVPHRISGTHHAAYGVKIISKYHKNIYTVFLVNILHNIHIKSCLSDLSKARDMHHNWCTNFDYRRVSDKMSDLTCITTDREFNTQTVRPSVYKFFSASCWPFKIFVVQKNKWSDKIFCYLVSLL